MLIQNIVHHHHFIIIRIISKITNESHCSPYKLYYFAVNSNMKMSSRSLTTLLLLLYIFVVYFGIRQQQQHRRAPLVITLLLLNYSYHMCDYCVCTVYFNLTFDFLPRSPHSQIIIYKCTNSHYLK